LAAPLTRLTAPDAAPRTSLRGGAGTPISDWEIDRLDHNAIFAGRNWRGYPGVLGKAGEMLTDAHVSSSRDAVVDLVAGSLFGFDAGDDTPAAKEAAAWQQYVWFERFAFRRFVGRQLRDTFTYGFGLSEQAERVESFSKDRFPLLGAKSDSAVVLADLRHVQPRTVDAWVPSRRDPSKLSEVQQEILQSDAEAQRTATIPANQLFRTTWRQEGANFEGFAPQRLAAGPWWVKRLLRKIEVLAHNKHHVGVPVITQGELAAPADDEKAVRAVSRWQANENAVVMLPFGYTLNLANTSPGTAIREAIDACNFDILHAQGFGYLLHGSGGSNTHGSYALADVQGGHAVARLDAWGDFLDEAMNFGFDGWSPVERLHRLNYGPDVAVPKFVVRHMPTVRFDQILPLIWEGIRVGAITPDRDLEEFARMVMKVSKYAPDLAYIAREMAGEAQAVKERTAAKGGDRVPA